MQPEAVADVIEAEGMAQLREQHGHHMARGGESAGLDAVFSFQAAYPNGERLEKRKGTCILPYFQCK